MTQVANTPAYLLHHAGNNCTEKLDFGTLETCKTYLRVIYRNKFGVCVLGEHSQPSLLFAGKT